VGRWWLNLHSQQVYWCPIFRAFLEVPDGADLQFSAAIMLYHPDDQPRVAAALRATAADGQIRTIQARRYTFTGRLIHISGTIEPVMFEGFIIGLRGSYQLQPRSLTPTQIRARNFTLALSCGESAVLYATRRITSLVPWLARPV